MAEIRRKGTVIYFVPIQKKFFSQWEYYQVDLEMLSECFSSVIVCHDTRSFIKAIFSNDVEAVYCWWWAKSVHCIVISKIFKLPVYVTGAVHMYDESGSQDFTSKGWLYRGSCRLAWRVASANLFISKSQFRQICSHERVHNAYLLKSSLPQSFDRQLASERYKKRLQHKSFGNAEKACFLTIVWMTRDQLRRKSVYETLGACKLLLEEGITNFEWVIAGEKSDGCEELTSKIAELGLESYVKVVNDVSQEEKAMLYESADLYVQPSYYEGFGNAVLEAMSHGLGAIVSRNTAQAEVIGDSGFMVEEIDPESIAKVMARYLVLSPHERIDHLDLVLRTINERHLFEYRLRQFTEIIGARAA